MQGSSQPHSLILLAPLTHYGDAIVAPCARAVAIENFNRSRCEFEQILEVFIGIDRRCCESPRD